VAFIAVALLVFELVATMHASAALVASTIAARARQPHASDAQPANQSRNCPPAPSDVAAVLRREMRRTDELRRLFALRSRASFSDKDPDVRSGDYFVSGNDGAAVFTWAVNERASRAGAGPIVAA